MPILDTVIDFFKAKDKVKQSDVLGLVRKEYPMYSQVEDSVLASAVAKKVPAFSFLSKYQPEEIVPADLVPKQLRDDHYYQVHPEVAKTDALSTIEQLKKTYPVYKDVPSEKLAVALETKYPEKFNKLVSRLNQNNSPGLPEKALKTVKAGIPSAPKIRNIQDFIKAASMPFNPETISTPMTQRAAGAFGAGLVGSAGSLVAAEPAVERALGVSSPIGRIAEDAAVKTRALAAELMPKDPNFGDQLLSGAGSMALFMAPGAGAVKVASSIPKVAAFSARFAPAIGASISTLMESATEGGDTYISEVEKGKKPEEAAKAAQKTFFSNVLLVGLTNKLGIFGESGKALKRALLSAPSEAVQEAGQSIIQSVSTGQPINWKEVAESAGVGAVIGGGAGGIAGAINPEMKQAEQVEEIKQVEAILEEIPSSKVEVIPEVKQEPLKIEEVQPETVPKIIKTELSPTGSEEVEQVLPERPKKVSKGITQKFTSLADLDKALGINAENTNAIIGETEKAISKKLPSKNLPVGLSTEIVEDVPRDAESGVSFKDKELEKRWTDAKGLRGTKIWEVVKDLGTKIKNSATRVYSEIPNDSEHSEFLQIVKDQKNNKTIAKEGALRLLQNVTLDLDKKDFDLFSRKIILDDLSFDAQQGKSLPFGLTPESLKNEKTRIDEMAGKNIRIAEAIQKRKRVQAAILEDLVQNNIIDPEQAKNPNYFHHQVLDYASARNYFGVGQGIKKPRPGFAKGRFGTEMDINTDYLQAEYDYMTQALQSIRNTEVLNRLERSKYNIKKKLMAEAKEKKIDWPNLIPEGYSLWQPQKGNVLFTQAAIPESAFEQIMEGVLPQDLARDYLFVGKKPKEMVLPDNIVATLERLNKFQERSSVDKVFDFLTKGLMNLWKRWTLFNPIRVLRYNYQNTIGDLDALIAANPRALKYFNRSFKEMMDHFYSDKPMTPDMRDFFERGGLTSGITIGELPELKESSIFSKFYDKASIKEKTNIVKKWFRAAGKVSTFRENLLRYGMYLDYLERFKSNDFDSKWVLKYGASNPKAVDALPTAKDKAAKVATEVFGDYANISELGQKMRERLIPFFSWMEINAKRYPEMLKNAAEQGVEGSAKARLLSGASVKAASSVLTWTFRATALWSLMQLWNNLRDPEAERELSEYDRKRMHILVGRDKEGNPMILRGQGALSDFLEWFGLNELPSLARLLADGKIDMPYLMKEIGKAPLNKGFQSISPMYKAVMEYFSGLSFFPDVTRPRAIRDRGRQIFQNVQLEDVYDYFTGKPQKPLDQILLKASPLVRSDVGQNAYQDIQNLKRLYLERRGEGQFQGGYFTPRSQAAYYYRLAIKYGDEKSKKKYLAELKKYGLEGDDYIRIIRGLHPLSGLSSKEKVGFFKFLTSEDKKKLERSIQYYRDLIKKTK